MRERTRGHVLAPGIAVLVVLLSGAARADAPPEETPPIPQTTELQGTVPDLRGRWLVVLRLGTAADQPAIFIPRFWDVEGTAAEPRVLERFVRLPADMAGRQKETGVQWVPTTADLAELKRGWQTLPPETDRPLASLKTELVERSRFDELMTKEDALSAAQWGVRQTAEFQPGQARPVREITLLGIEETTPGGFRGKAAYVMLAMAPFPVPVALRGTVDLYRVEAPERGFLGRLMDAFAGCGRGGG